MEPNKKNCPYCGEEIMAAAKKCKWCGEWLDKEIVTPTRVPTPMVEKVPEIHENISVRPPIKINNLLLCTIMAIAALVSVINLVMKAIGVGEAIPVGVMGYILVVLVLSVIAFSVVSVIKNKPLSMSMSLLAAVEVLSLCTPIEQYIYNNDYITYIDLPGGDILLKTAIAAILAFVVMKFLSSKVASTLYICISAVCVLFSIAMFVIIYSQPY